MLRFNISWYRLCSVAARGLLCCCVLLTITDPHGSNVAAQESSTVLHQIGSFGRGTVHSDAASSNPWGSRVGDEEAKVIQSARRSSHLPQQDTKDTVFHATAEINPTSWVSLIPIKRIEKDDTTAPRSYPHYSSIDGQSVQFEDKFSRVPVEVHTPGEQTTKSQEKFRFPTNQFTSMKIQSPLVIQTTTATTTSRPTASSPTTNDDEPSFSKLIMRIPVSHSTKPYVPDDSQFPQYDAENAFLVPDEELPDEADQNHDNLETNVYDEEFSYDDVDDSDVTVEDDPSESEDDDYTFTKLPSLESSEHTDEELLPRVAESASRLPVRYSHDEPVAVSPAWLPVRDTKTQSSNEVISQPINAWINIRTPPRFPGDIDVQLGKVAIKPTDIDEFKSGIIRDPIEITISSTTKDVPTETTSSKPSTKDYRKPCVFPYTNTTRQDDDEDESSWLAIGESPWSRASAANVDCRTPQAVTAGKNTYGFTESLVQEAANVGLDRMTYFYNITEPALYEMGMALQPGSPGSLSAAFNWQPEETIALSRYAHAALQAATHLYSQPNILRLPDGRLPTPDSSLLKQCPLNPNRECPSESLRYRMPDGSCNNPRHSAMGAAFLPFRRLMPPEYRDGIQKLRRSVTGEKLPSARKVSATALRDPVGSNDAEMGENLFEESPVSHLYMQHGQFLDHDLTATPQSFGFNGSVIQCCTSNGASTLPSHVRHPECLAIRVDNNDPFFSAKNVHCLQFVRSAPAPMRDCGLGPRQQMNAVTPYLDGSAIYGSNQQRQLELRLFHKGMMNSLPGKQGKPMLPPAPPEEHSLCRFVSNQPCLRAGDLRANEQPALTSIHIVWLREHNRVANKLSELNPHWDDERLYQESRRIIVGMLQHITMTEFLPLLLGPDVMKVFGLTSIHPGYNPDIDPTVPNSFAAAAFRFGHTLVQDTLTRCNALHRPIPFNKTLHAELAVAGVVLNPGAPERLMIGLARQLSRSSDRRISRQLTDHLFESKDSGPGLDLAALNIQRGRDHGLPAYNKWRQPCGLRTLQSFDDLQFVATSRYASVLPQLYRDVNDIDLYVGGIAERPVPGGLVGPTFACIIGQTFSDLRLGDRFWYEVQNQFSSFTPAQLVQIKRSSMARILCDNLEGIRTVAKWPLRASPATPGNEYYKCSDTKHIPQFRFDNWKEAADGSSSLMFQSDSENINVNKPPNKPNIQPAAARPTRKPIVRPVVIRPGNRPNRPGNRPGNRPNRPGNRPGNRPNRPNIRPVKRPGNRPNNRPGNRPNKRPNAKPVNRPGVKVPISIPKPVPALMPFRKPQVMVINISNIARRRNKNKNRQTTANPLIEGQRSSANKTVVSEDWLEIPKPMTSTDKV